MSLSQCALLDNCTDIQYSDLLRKPFEVNHGDQQCLISENTPIQPGSDGAKTCRGAHECNSLFWKETDDAH